MPSPFPGMDPYLENPDEWQDIHTRFLANLLQNIAPRLPQAYSVSVEARLFIEEDEAQSARYFGRADVGVVQTETGLRPRGGATLAPIPLKVTIPNIDFRKERYLEIRDGRAGRHVVTVIELLSPTNKRPDHSRDAYLQKRLTVLASDANLVEIDLLRTGFRMPVDTLPNGTDYYALVVRKAMWPHADLYPATLRDRLPAFHVPLAGEEVGPLIDLNEVLTETYDRGELSRRIDYTSDPVPSLNPDDAAWADALLHEKGLR